LPVRKVVIDKANRLYQMPPEVNDFIPVGHKFFGLGRTDVIDLASFHWPVPFEGDPRPQGHQLSPASDQQIANLREELAGWLTRTHGTKILPDKEIFIGGNISTLAFQMALAYLDAGDAAFVPAVGVPLYRACVTACNGQPVPYSISAKSDWTPKFDRLNTGLGRVARLLYLNSPHNPTGVELTHKDLSELVWTAGRQNTLIVNDAAYASISPRLPVSLLAVVGGKKVGVELGSFAYQFGLPPLPFGYAVGSREAVSGLEKTARLTPRYLPASAVEAAIEAIRRHPSGSLLSVRERIGRSAAGAGELLELLHLERVGKTAVPFEWARIDRRLPSTNLARTLFRRFRIVVAPGLAFGENGEGYLRFSLLADPEAYAEACRRVRKSRLIRKPREEA
jgi:aspartate/methionine/tyrosine aminotransferase